MVLANYAAASRQIDVWLDDIPDKRPQFPAIKGLTVDTGEIPIIQFDEVYP